MSSEDDGEGYVHDPAALRESEGAASDPSGGETPTGADRQTGLGRRGWVLLGTVVVAFFGAPAVIYLRPPGVPFEVALLAVPLLPAFLLGAVAVWAMAERKR